MPVTLEIIASPASQAYLDDPAVLEPALELLSKVPGVANQWTGLKIEDKKTVYLVVQWESESHYTNFTTSPTSSSFLALLKPAFASQDAPKTLTVTFPDDVSPENTLNAPVTEFCYSRLKDHGKKDELVELETGLAGKLTKGEGCFGPAPVAESNVKGTLVLLIGWDSVERHVKAVENEQGVEQMLDLSDLDVFHVAFKRYAPAS